MEFDEALKRVFESKDLAKGLYLSGKSDFNRCLDHIVRLLDDATMLYKSGSYPTSVFLSISVIEEVSKTHIAFFRAPMKGGAEKPKRDPLRDHAIKEVLGSAPTIVMGSRLKETIGKNQIEQIIKLASEGSLKRMREEALYWDLRNNNLHIPADNFDKEFARDLLLFAIESFDDNLVGYTNYSFAVGAKTDILFEKIAHEI